MTSIWFKTGLVAVLFSFLGLFALTAGSDAKVVDVRLNARTAVINVAPGVKMRAWTFNGTVPGPVIRASEGDTVRVTLRNSHRAKRVQCPRRRGIKRRRCLHRRHQHQAMWHSVDFHAAKIAPNVAFRNVAPGESFTFEFEASVPGVYMYHCGTGPMLQHIGMGMHGMIVVDPAVPRPPAREVFLVQSEYYGRVIGRGVLNSTYHAMRTTSPRYVTFNGRSMRYARSPIKVAAGEPIRAYFVNSGPSLFSAFHVVGTIFDNFQPDGNPAGQLYDVSTQVVGPGAGGIFEFSLPEPGSYPFVSHSVIDMDRGAVGTFEAI